MGKQVLKDCQVIINGVNLSDHASSVEINFVKDEVETTNFSGSGRERIAGLKDDSFVVTFQQDYAAGEVDDTLFALYNGETEFVVEVRPTAAAASPTNPKFTGTCIILEYQPLSGSVGDLSETEVTFPSQRTGITRATA